MSTTMDNSTDEGPQGVVYDDATAVSIMSELWAGYGCPVCDNPLSQGHAPGCSFAAWWDGVTLGTKNRLYELHDQLVNPPAAPSPFDDDATVMRVMSAIRHGQGCIICGLPQGQGHSPECPFSDWWQALPNRERARLHDLDLQLSFPPAAPSPSLREQALAAHAAQLAAAAQVAAERKAERLREAADLLLQATHSQEWLNGQTWEIVYGDGERDVYDNPVRSPFLHVDDLYFADAYNNGGLYLVVLCPACGTFLHVDTNRPARSLATLGLLITEGAAVLQYHDERVHQSF